MQPMALHAQAGVDVSCNEETNGVGRNSNASSRKVLEIFGHYQDDTRPADFRRGQDSIISCATYVEERLNDFDIPEMVKMPHLLQVLVFSLDF